MRMTLVCALLIVCMTGLAACGSTLNKSDTSQEYYTQTNLSELEYQMYLANKISVATGQINTHMGKIQNTAEGSCSYEDEIAALNNSIDILKENKKDMTFIYPPDIYSSTRENALKYWQDAIDKMQETAEILEDGYMTTDDAEAITDELSDIYTSIQSLNFTV